MTALIAGATWCAAWWTAVWIARPHPFPSDDPEAWYMHMRLYSKWEVCLTVTRLITILYVAIALIALLVNVSTGPLVLDPCYLKDWGSSSC